MGEEMTVEFQLASEAGYDYQISEQVLQFFSNLVGKISILYCIYLFTFDEHQFPFHLL
jgi:hypothetical protein